jgi:hypothetical protein
MFKTSLLYGATVIASVAVAVSAGAGAQQPGIPNFMSTDFGWQLEGGIDFRPVEGKLAPVSHDPAYPPAGPGNQRGVMERMGDAENANLTPWAKDIMRKYNRDVLDGHRAFSSQSRCWPGGVPGQLLFPAEPIFFIQTPTQVWIIWQRDQHVRRVFLDRPHSANITPSWFGESVGRYENGELVIDTIGFNEHEFGFVDNWRTPHTKDLHVVERWRVVDGGNAIEAIVTVEDPGAFKAPWTGSVRWAKQNRGPMVESICAENNLNYETYFKLREYPMPQDNAPDF